MDTFDPHKDEDGAYLATALVAYALGLKTEEVFSEVFSAGRGSRAATKARHIAMYITYSSLGISLARVSRAFGRDRSTVAHACQVVEDRREDVDFDDWCAQLEMGLRSVVGLKPRLVELGAAATGASDDAGDEGSKAAAETEVA